MPKFNFDGAASGVAGTGNFESDNIYRLVNIFSYSRGRHSLKAGVEIQTPQQNVTTWNSVQGSWSFAASMTGIGSANTQTYIGLPAGSATDRGAATFLLGFPSSVTIAPAVIPYQYRWKYYAGCVQDDFKVTPRLTLNLGLRLQVEVPRSEKNHNQGNFIDDFAVNSQGVKVRGYVQLSGLGKGPATLFPTRYNNIEPRFGFACRLENLKWLKVVRGGYGISHVPTYCLFSPPYPDLSPKSDQLATNGGRAGGQVQVDWNPLILPQNWAA
ncbi:MAG: TonB-dependent receptor [Candidatus Solibacter sp.]|nr:TonB-dependent receptor [Candidatus Solibacter sp.]